MSMTLKIRWTRFAPSEDGIWGVADETVLFIPAREVRVHGFIDAGTREDKMKAWDQSSTAGYFNYLEVNARKDGNGDAEQGGRLIQVIRPDHTEEWYLATMAWLLGDNGDTIERVAP